MQAWRWLPIDTSVQSFLLRCRTGESIVRLRQAILVLLVSRSASSSPMSSCFRLPKNASARRLFFNPFASAIIDRHWLIYALYLGLDGLHKWLPLWATGVGQVLRLAPNCQLGSRCVIRERLLLTLAWWDLVGCWAFLEEHVFVSGWVYRAVALLALFWIRIRVDLIVWRSSLSLILKVLALSFGHSCHLNSKLIFARNCGDRFSSFWGSFLALFLPISRWSVLNLILLLLCALAYVFGVHLGEVFIAGNEWNAFERLLGLYRCLIL